MTREPNLVFCSVVHGYDRQAPWLTSPHRVAGLPMTSIEDCRLLEAMLTQAMGNKQGADLERLVRWHHAVVDTRRRAEAENWPGW